VVDKVTINKERELQVWFRFNLLALGSQAENFRENKLAGTYTRKSDMDESAVVRVVI